MKAMVVREPKGSLELDERERPKPKADEVLIHVRACGVCHGDLMLQQGEFPFVTYPIVPGHEVAGLIAEIGEGVERWKPGDRVGLSALFSTCGACRYCLSGDENLCLQWCWTGLMTDGGYQEFMIAKAAYLAPLPEGIDFAEIAPVMCAGLTVFSGLRNASFEPGNKVAVIGFGGLGQYGLLYAKAMGARVAVVSTSAEKEAEARQMGAERFIDATQGSLGDSLRKWEGGADIILATSPSLEPMNAAFPGLAPEGTNGCPGSWAGQSAN
jgi:alcohol dehydrogenase, propanol-preferring